MSVEVEESTETVLYWKPREDAQWIVAYEREVPGFIKAGYNVKKVTTYRRVETEQLGDPHD